MNVVRVAALVLGLRIFLSGAVTLAQQTADNLSSIRFCTVDIYLDSGSTRLAAYQVEFAVTKGVWKIVGIEGGEDAAFRSAPHYDSKAVQNERAIIAAFSLLPKDSLPSGRTRVATVHLMVTGGFNLIRCQPRGSRIQV